VGAVPGALEREDHEPTELARRVSETEASPLEVTGVTDVRAGCEWPPTATAGPRFAAGDAAGGAGVSPGTLGDVPCVTRAGPFSVSLVTHRAATVLAPHHHSSATVTVVLGGDYAEELPGDSRVLAPMSAASKPPGVVHGNRFGARGARSLLLEVEERSLHALGEAARVFDAPRFLAIGPAAAVAVELVAELRREHERARPAEGAPARLSEGALARLSLEGLVHEWFGLVAVERRALDERRTPRWLARVRDRVHGTPAGALRLADLAADAGHHPSYVARVFRRHYGLSIGDYARRLRIARAARALALAPRDSLSRVALEMGYYDHSHLTHDFRARTRTSPAAWRRLVASGALHG
jgi:AraC family transcriptional regulator